VMRFLTSASVTPKIMEIEIRRKYMSRIADSVLKTSIWMSVKNTFSAELVRLPSFYKICRSLLWYCIPGIVPFKSPAHHLLKYLVNTDLMRSAPCSRSRPQARPLRTVWPERPCKICCTNKTGWIKGCQAAQDVQESYQGPRSQRCF
jgi:hypothetical protein